MKKEWMMIFCLALATPVFAETTPEPVASAHTLTGSLTVASDYVVRGIDQTFGRPALIGEIDYTHASGFYVGNYYANVNSGAGYPGGDLEMDFYGGHRSTLGDVSLDMGAMYYSYPGTDASIAAVTNPRTGQAKSSGAIRNTEVYLATSWKMLTLKYSYAVSDYFSIPGTKGSGYIELAINQDIGDGWAAMAHIGHMNLKNYSSAAGISGNYTDWKLGLTKVIGDWQLGLAYIASNANGGTNGPYYYGNAASGSSQYKNSARNMLVASVTRNF